MRNSPALHMAPPAIHPYLVRHTLAAAGLPAQGDGGWADGRPPYEEGCRDKTLGWLRAAASSRCHARGRNVAPRPRRLPTVPLRATLGSGLSCYTVTQ